MSNNRQLEKGRNHVQWPDNSKKGEAHTALEEPTPEYFARPGDVPIRGANNALIVLGRDRTGLNEKSTKTEKNSQSGFSDHMAAGAIDIVVGRGAPWPVRDLITNATGSAEQDGRPFELGPLFRTKYKIDKLKTVTLSNHDKQGEEVASFSHPGYAMDAARIYISQMTAVDESFGIGKLVNFDGTDPDEASAGVIPTSAIVVKADKIRMHARQDIKIITGGEGENYNSQGNYNIIPIGKIHLMPGNGLSGKQQPIPLGNNLVEGLDEILKVMDNFVNNIDAFVKSQSFFNSVVADHVHSTAPVQGAALPSPILLAFGAKTSLDHLSQNVFFGSLAIKDQISKIRDTYLRDFYSSSNDKTETKYICSSYTTTS